MGRLLPALLLLLPGFGGQEAGAVTGRARFPDGAFPKARAKVRYTEQAGRQEIKEAPPCPVLVTLEGAPAGGPKDGLIEIKQEGLQFRPRAVAARLGTRVSFPNFDREFHNVFSYSKAKRFDLGRYPKGETREILCDRAGLVRVYCEIHEHMRAYILVVEHSYFATAADDGTFAIRDVAPGSYTLTAWHEGFDTVRKAIEVKSGQGVRVDVTFVRASGPGGSDPLTACCGSPAGADAGR